MWNRPFQTAKVLPPFDHLAPHWRGTDGAAGPDPTERCAEQRFHRRASWQITPVDE
jgi:hypothetical protein